MQGFTPMTPEERQEGNPIRSARPAYHLETQMSLLSALLTSAFRALTQVAAVMHHEGRLNSKKSSKMLAAIDEINTTASLTLDVGGIQEDCRDEEDDPATDDDLPELTDGDDNDSEDGFLDQENHEIAEHHLRKLGESKPEAEAAFCDDKLHTRSSLAELLPCCMVALMPCCFGVVPSRNGCQDGVAGTISMMEGHEKLKKVTSLALDGEQRQQMNQVASCDGTNAQFCEYAYVDAIAATGTPSATLHRMHVFVMETDSNWDLLCGTGLVMNSLKLSLDLFKSVATCWAGVSSKGGQPVTLPLARPNVYKLGAGPKRKEHPLVCFQTEIYANVAQQPEHKAETSAAGAAAGDQDGLPCWLPTTADKVLEEEDMCEAYRALMNARSPLNTLNRMTIAEMSDVNADQDNERLGILPDFKRQRQMPFQEEEESGDI
ncbi:hypothetical protein CYMTET_9218 [Cymbomonas tetramitiformis]|uniref:Uncharacterized protein n=1 Tax=Cymbomonas tetramitiformis TaxID=36881 RepID=A0AAE0GRI2_9CHLO|nr:hypothetical protein CYMTET_9218 [Cymbomonas tetramitiformis]